MADVSTGSGFADLLRELKNRSGHSYGTLAKRLHMSTSTLHRYCNGDAVPADYAPVERLARLCRATPEELVELHRRWVLADAGRGRREPAPVQETAAVAAEPVADEVPEAVPVQGPRELVPPVSDIPGLSAGRRAPVLAPPPAPYPDRPPRRPRRHGPARYGGARPHPALRRGGGGRRGCRAGGRGRHRPGLGTAAHADGRCPARPRLRPRGVRLPVRRLHRSAPRPTAARAPRTPPPAPPTGRTPPPRPSRSPPTPTPGRAPAPSTI
ncbi:helix-turn-helix domain-containing protein [Streptomyces lasalocidi]